MNFQYKKQDEVIVDTPSRELVLFWFSFSCRFLWLYGDIAERLKEEAMIGLNL